MFIHLFMGFFFFISIFVGATARHPQHTDDQISARGRVQKEESTNIVPEEEKGGRRWGGKREERAVSTVPSGGQLGSSHTEHRSLLTSSAEH